MKPIDRVKAMGKKDRKLRMTGGRRKSPGCPKGSQLAQKGCNIRENTVDEMMVEKMWMGGRTGARARERKRIHKRRYDGMVLRGSQQ